MFIAEIIIEAGAGPSRILHHIQNGTPFLTLSAFKDTLPHEENLQRDARLKHILRGLPVSYIPTEGEYTMKGATEPSPELSYFVMPAKEWSPQSLEMLGRKLRGVLDQESVVYGDGDTVWLLMSNGSKYKLGNRVTYRPQVIDTLGGSSKVKNRKFSFTNYQKAPGAAIYGERIPPKKLDRVRNLP